MWAENRDRTDTLTWLELLSRVWLSRQQKTTRSCHEMLLLLLLLMMMMMMILTLNKLRLKAWPPETKTCSLLWQLTRRVEVRMVLNLGRLPVVTWWVSRRAACASTVARCSRNSALTCEGTGSRPPSSVPTLVRSSPKARLPRNIGTSTVPNDRCGRSLMNVHASTSATSVGNASDAPAAGTNTFGLFTKAVGRTNVCCVSEIFRRRASWSATWWGIRTIRRTFRVRQILLRSTWTIRRMLKVRRILRRCTIMIRRVLEVSRILLRGKKMIRRMLKVPRIFLRDTRMISTVLKVRRILLSGPFARSVGKRSATSTSTFDGIGNRLTSVQSAVGSSPTAARCPATGWSTATSDRTCVWAAVGRSRRPGISACTCGRTPTSAGSSATGAGSRSDGPAAATSTSGSYTRAGGRTSARTARGPSPPPASWSGTWSGTRRPNGSCAARSAGSSSEACRSWTSTLPATPVRGCSRAVSAATGSTTRKRRGSTRPPSTRRTAGAVTSASCVVGGSAGGQSVTPTCADTRDRSRTRAACAIGPRQTSVTSASTWSGNTRSNVNHRLWIARWKIYFQRDVLMFFLDCTIIILFWTNLILLNYYRVALWGLFWGC